MKTPYIVYYVHYKDKEWREPNYGKVQDFSVCVMAENAEEAAEKARELASQNGPHIRIWVWLRVEKNGLMKKNH